MLKITGALLCVVGSAGFGFIKIRGWKQALEEIKIWIVLFQRVKSCILYQKETLEGSCSFVGEREASLQGAVLQRIGQRAGEERNNEFSTIWFEEMELWCKKATLPDGVQQLLLQFPEYIREADEMLQINLFSLYMEELRQEKTELEKRIKEQQKPVMAISLVVGMMLSILLV